MKIMAKYPKTIKYEDLDGNKKSQVVNNEFEQRVLENQIEEQMRLKAELDVESDRFSYEMAALKEVMKGKSKEEQLKEDVENLKEKYKKRKEELNIRREQKAKQKAEQIAEKKAKQKVFNEKMDKANEKWRKATPLQKSFRFLVLVLILSVLFFGVFAFFGLRI